MLLPCTYQKIQKPEWSYVDPAVSAKYVGHLKVAERVAGIRVMYFNRLEKGEIWLLTLYAKSERSSIPPGELRLLKEVIDYGP